jgi:hypothetical protein
MVFAAGLRPKNAGETLLMNISSTHLVERVSNHCSIGQLLMLLSFPILAPSGFCCDNCANKEATIPCNQVPVEHTALSTLSHPTMSETVSPSTPSKIVNPSCKRTMRDPDLGPITRHEQHLEEARAVLQEWRHGLHAIMMCTGDLKG